MIQGEFFKFQPPKPRPFEPKEWKVVALRECLSPAELCQCDTPELAALYWKANILSHPLFDPERECLIVLLLNTRNKLKGHHFVSTGTMDSVLACPTSVFRAAVICSAASILLMHNHPSGEHAPSSADVRVTRELIQAGRILKVTVINHVIMGTGDPGYTSMRSSGMFDL